MFLAMGRTGHHAVMEWVCQNLLGMVFFGNACKNGWEKKEFIPNKKVKEYDNGDGNVHTVMSIEDFYLPLWKKHDMDHWEQQFDFIITIVRSPRNWLASSIAAKGWCNDYLDKVCVEKKEMYPVSRIEAFVGYLANQSKVLRAGERDLFTFNKRTYTTVSYDKWFSDELYRAFLASILKMNIGPKPEHCKFSSFGKDRDYNGDRYKLLNEKQKKRFDSLYKGKLKKYQEEYFGFNS
jgi:hypothetical protein